MRLYHVVFTILYLVTGYVVIAGNVPLYARQTDGGTTMVTTTSSDQSTAQSTQAPGTIASTASDHTSSMTASVSTTVVDIHTDIGTESGLKPTAGPVSNNSTNATGGATEMDTLPIGPRITPALGVAGAVLIVLGMGYNLIGIKNQWIHVFLSAAFLTSLAVTVLIVYVMSPPVRDAVQGAYFVAAFLTGIIFGALSLVFKELTEGLGCILGGFCLSMWILSLKAGGILTSSGSKGALIGALCVVSYALSFSSYTRPYALIGSTAFAGGTATVLGIDCFSRAGLKEFWLYIWDLNDNIFPLDTTTYPVTRGIRVELAIVIIIFLLGSLSQFKLWKVVRDRRKKQAALEAEEKRKKDESEAELGRKLEEGNMRELSRWEAVYGDGDKQQSVSAETDIAESQQKFSTTVEIVEAPGDAVEMKDWSQSGHDSGQPTMIDEKEPSEDVIESSKTEQFGIQMVETSGQEDLIGEETPQQLTPEQSFQAETELFTKTPEPVVTPLPFKVPDGDDVRKDEDGGSVQAAFDDAESMATRISKRFSGNTLFRRLSHWKNNRNSTEMPSESEEMLVPIQPDSPASSVQGIADGDDESDFDTRSNPSQSDILHTHQAVEVDAETCQNPVQRASDVPPESDELAVPSESHLESKYQPADKEGVRQGHQSSKAGNEGNDPQLVAQAPREPTEQIPPPETNSKSAAEIDCGRSEGLDIVAGRQDKPFNVAALLPAGQIFSLAPVTSLPLRSSNAASEKDDAPAKRVSSSGSQSRASTRRKASLTAGAIERLPSYISPVVMSFRTNEWAKHLSEAEPPQLEPIRQPQEDFAGATVADAEVAAPLKVEELQQTATNAPRSSTKDSRVLVVAEPKSHIIERSSSRVSRQSMNDMSKRHSPKIHADGLSREPATSSPNLLLSPSSHPPHQQPGTLRGLRSSSSAFLSTSLATAPIHESEIADFQEPRINQTSSLMAQRESMIRNRASSVSLARDSWTPRSRSLQSLKGQPTAVSQFSLLEDDDDDMPLTQRRALLQRGAGNLPTDLRRTALDTYSVNRPSRKPSRSKSQMTMAAWRESLREDLLRSHTPMTDVNVARSGMMEQQRKAQMVKQQRTMASEHLYNSIAEKMQRGEMQGLHREAMRRMQATANRKVNG